MATRNLVPRADGEGSLGTVDKQWGAMRAKNIYIDGVDITEQVTETSDKADAAAASATAAAASVTQAETIKDSMLAGYGYPFTAATAADMTDTDKIYVYTGSETGYTNGDWYYHDGTDWVSGGAYNAVAFDTDTTLTISGAAADAQVTGNIKNMVEHMAVLLDIELGVGRYLSGNTIAKNSSSLRASFAPMSSEYFDKILIVPKSGMSVYVYGYVDNNSAWAQLNSSPGYTEPTEVDLSGISVFFCSAHSTTEITETPFHIYAHSKPDVLEQSGNTKKLLKKNLRIDIGINRFISNGAIITGELSTRASSPVFLPRSETFIVESDREKYQYSIAQMLQDGTWANKYTQISGNCVVNVSPGMPLFFQILSYTAMPSDAVPISVYAFDDVCEKSFDNSLLKWELGAISSGAPTASNARIRTCFLKAGKGTTIVAERNFFVAVNRYDAQKRYLGDSGGWVSQYRLASDCYIRVVLRKSNSASMAGDDLDELAENCKVYFKNPGSIYTEEQTSFEVETRRHYKSLMSQARFSPTSNAKVLTLMHFSDIHGNLNAMKKAVEIANDYDDMIDDMIHTGDVVVANYSDGLTNWINSGCAAKVISVIGNHDSEENLTLGTAGKANVYSGMLAPYIDNWGVVQPVGVNDPQSANYCACHYYKDYSTANIRLIVLDGNWWDNAQKQWLDDVLTDALTNEYSIILACHTPRFVTGITDANFCSYTEPIINEPAAFANITNDWLDPVNSFMAGGGEVICMLSGHNHRDHIGYLTNYPNILCITADKASIARTVDTARIAGEDNETAYNIVTFNTTDKWIKIVRMGAEVDGQMRGKHVFCYDYANRRIISQW